MPVKEQVLAILKEVKPTKDLGGLNDIVGGGYIDSFELMISTMSSIICSVISLCKG